VNDIRGATWTLATASTAGMLPRRHSADLRGRIAYLLATLAARRRYEWQGDATMISARVSERPKYPAPPRSGNAFAAAVLAAIPGLLLLIVLFWVYARCPLTQASPGKDDEANCLPAPEGTFLHGHATLLAERRSARRPVKTAAP